MPHPEHATPTDRHCRGARVQYFRFKAIDASGKTVQGEGDSPSEEELIKDLRSRKLTVLSIEVTERPTAVKAKPKPAAKPGAGKSGGKPGLVEQVQALVRPSVSKKTLSLFTRQLATTLAAGLPLLRILSLLHKKAKDRSIRNVLEKVGNELQHGVSFSQALTNQAGVFDATYLNMVRVGELGGNLSESMARLATMLEKDTALQRKVRGALFYPVFVLAFTVIIGYVMLTYLMPMFTPMFENSGLNIREKFPLTYFLMQASAFASSPTNMLELAIGCVVLGFGLRTVLRTGPGRFALDFALYYTPGFSTMVQQAAAARFSRAFSTLLKSGVPMLQALQLVAEASGNAVVSRSIATVVKNIQSGDRVSETLEHVGVFPDLVVQMAAIGEEAGSLPEMLERVADYYDAELDTTVAALAGLIEPLMMLLVGLLVGVFVMGILLPILGISTAYQQQMGR
jgi:type IV pilus assembly protein PilC